MQVELRALLASSLAVKPLLSADKIAWKRLPQRREDLPCIVLHVVSGTDGLTQQGPDGLWQGRVQIDCYAADYATAATLAGAVRGFLHGYRGEGFRGVFAKGIRDDQDEGASDRPFLISTDFMVNWRET